MSQWCASGKPWQCTCTLSRGSWKPHIHVHCATKLPQGIFWSKSDDYYNEQYGCVQTSPGSFPFNTAFYFSDCQPETVFSLLTAIQHRRRDINCVIFAEWVHIHHVYIQAYINFVGDVVDCCCNCSHLIHWTPCRWAIVTRACWIMHSQACYSA